ncbi:retrovirus-related pol polyprotein from transposon TNT 1-94 [Tanacetum coccineum]
MNNEVTRVSVDKQCAEIEKKNLLIENENLIVNCLSTQLLYDVAKSRCLDLEADVSKSQASPEAPDFRSFFKIKNLEHQIQEKDNVIGHLKDIVTNVNDRSREPHSAVDVTALIEQNNCDRLELEKVRTGHALVSGLGLLQTYDGESFKLMNFVEMFIGSARFGNDHLGALSWGYFVDSDLEWASERIRGFVRDLMVDILKRSKDETPEFVTNFLKQIQVGLNKTVRFIRTDNGTEFVNQALSAYYEGVGISHQKSVPRTPQQNGVVERRNRTLVEAARTMMIFSKAPMFLWAEALVHEKKPDLTFFRVFGALCYPTNDSKNLGKFQAKADIGIFVGYAPSRKGE